MLTRNHAVLAALLLAGCADSCSGGTGELDDTGSVGGGDVQGYVTSRQVRLAVPLPDVMQSFTVPAGVSVGTPIPIDLGGMGQYIEMGEVTVDLGATAAEAVVFPTDESPEDGAVAALTLRMGPAGSEATVCTSGEAHGPAQFTLDGTGAPTDSSPAELPLDETTVAALNDDGMLLCYEADFPVELTVQLRTIYVWITLGLDCDASAPADLPSQVAGTYSCENTCGDGEGGDITIDIEQDGDVARYVDDGGAQYEGLVCGSDFVHMGGAGDPLGSDYLESGVLTFSPDERTATKVSFWQSGFCGGTCNDQLTVVE